MSEPNDYRVPPLRWADVDRKANAVRELLKLTNQPYLDVVTLTESILCNRMELSEFQVVAKSEMGNAEGLTCPKGSFIRFREDVYEKACAGDYRARFTFAHELGHFFLHRNAPLARASKSDGTPPYMLAEPQANRFAATLLMPQQHIFASDEAKDLVQRCGVSWEAASNRLSETKRKGIS